MEPRTIAVVFPGDARARGTWSGTPAGIAEGLAELGHRVLRVDARAPAPLERTVLGAVALGRTRPGRGGPRAGRAAARLSPAMAALRTRGVAAALRRTGRVDAIVQIGTGYAIPGETPVITYEDMTIPQAVALAYPGWDLLPARAVRSRMERQRRAYQRAAVCCTSTAWAATSIVEDYGIAPAKVQAIGIGRNHEPLAAGRDWGTPRFLFVGLDWAGKNGDGLLRAFARLRERVPDAALDVVGGHPRLDAAGVTGHGILSMDEPEQRRRLEALYGAATCFVMPSHKEASAIVYVEAAAAGLPVIGTAVGGSADLIGDGGCVVHPDDDEELLAAMLRLGDPATAARVGAAARERSRRFTWRAVAERMLAELDA
jgi:glycosyltransferase involved in cell wall biosynthesis